MADNKSDISINSLYNRAIGVLDHSTTQKKTISGTSVRSTVLRGNGTYLISTDTNCHIIFGGAADDATTSHHIMFAGESWVVHTGKGTAYYVSAIQDTAGGFLYITEQLGDRLG